MRERTQMFKPNIVNILGKSYPIQYCDNPADVDIHKRESKWGQVDFWERSIRIYDNGHNSCDLLDGILHEIIHVITVELKIGEILESSKEEEIVSLLALALADTLQRNGWMK